MSKKIMLSPISFLSFLITLSILCSPVASFSDQRSLLQRQQRRLRMPNAGVLTQQKHLKASVPPLSIVYSTIPQQKIVTRIQRTQLSSTSTPTSSSSSIETSQQLQPEETIDTIICGGGPAGLLTAIMLSQKNKDRKKKIQLYDRLQAPPHPDDTDMWNTNIAKFYLIGLGGRGQTALKEFGVWEKVEEKCVAVRGRKDWQPNGDPEGNERIFTSKEKQVTTQVLPRDKLVGVLHQYILAHCPDVELNYGYELVPLDFEFQDKTKVLVAISKCTDDIVRQNPSEAKTATDDPENILCDIENAKVIATDLLIAADGTVRTVANAMEAEDKRKITKAPLSRLWRKPFSVKRYVNDNERVYKTIPMKIPQDWRPDLNYSARTNRINYDALPANKDGDYCGVLLFKRDDPLAKENTDPKELRSFMDEALPQFSQILDDTTLAAVAEKPVSYLPGFRYAGPRLHQGNNCIIMGDCAHTVKPYFGLGANSALEDVRVFSQILDTAKDTPEAVKQFSKMRAGEAKALVRISRDLDRPGFVGFVTFILPLILDSIFSKAAPKLFKPNIIAMLQRDNLSFQQVARRKRIDRLNQFLLIASTLALTSRMAILTLGGLAKLMKRRRSTVTTGIFLSLVAACLLKRFISLSGLNSVAGEVPGKTTAKEKPEGVGNAETFLTPLPFGNKKG